MDNTYSAYSLIKGTYCTVDMSKRIDQLPDFEARVRNNPFELLKSIQVLSRTSVRAQYSVLSTTEVMLNLCTSRQYDGEDLLDYTR